MVSRLIDLLSRVSVTGMLISWGIGTSGGNFTSLSSTISYPFSSDFDGIEGATTDTEYGTAQAYSFGFVGSNLSFFLLHWMGLALYCAGPGVKSVL